MKKRMMIGIIYAALLCTACSGTSFSGADPMSEADAAGETNADDENEDVQLGSSLTVTKPDSSLKLSGLYDVLASDGLYYATWVAGNSVDHINADGATVDLYDTQLHLLLGEYPTEENAQANADNWLAATMKNYDVNLEEDVLCGSVSYHVISYDCEDGTNPYDRGISAFTANGKDAVCAELTCVEEFDGDLRTILLNFLEHCDYTD